jgi:hypothetical protein
MRGTVGGLLAVVAVMAAASGAQGVVISVGSASGQMGDQVSVGVSLATEGAAVLATQNQIAFGRQAFIPAGAGGGPACVVNPAIEKEATAFRFLPLGCDPAVDCASVRVFVLSFSNLEPIDDGAMLYTCTVQIAAAAPLGEYPLTIGELGASAAMGVLLPVTGTSGAVTVAAEPEVVAEVRIGSATGAPGETVPIEARLALLDEAAEVVGVEANLTFTAAASVAATLSGAPDCTLDPDISMGVESFVFQPNGCTAGTDCTGVRALLFSLANTEPLPDDALLFTCDVAIGAATAAGVYPLTAGPMLGSDPDGGPLLLIGADGAVTVELPPPPACVGDCDGSGEVSVNELLIGVNILLGSTAVAQCPAMDVGADGSVSVSEIIAAVNVALGTCPG